MKSGDSGLKIGAALAAWVVAVLTFMGASSQRLRSWTQKYSSSVNPHTRFCNSANTELFQYLERRPQLLSLCDFRPTIDAIFSPIFTALNAMPRIALAPLFIIWFGLGLGSK